MQWIYDNIIRKKYAEKIIKKGEAAYLIGSVLIWDLDNGVLDYIVIMNGNTAADHKEWEVEKKI